ncbi:unnamed protein product [Rotaria sp. Silwood2]|nr:unnamed protein product [Rotaria sp. Silwood2]CAF4346819.1 unnamed protein product [Rotaria sp. Silwood2]
MRDLKNKLWYVCIFLLPVFVNAQTVDISQVGALNTSILEKPTAEAYYKRGLIMFSLGDNTGAIRDMTSAIELNPGMKEMYFIRGKAKDAIGSNTAAIKDFDKAIELDNTYSDAYSYRGVSKKVTGDFDGAITDFNKAIELNPANAEAYNNRGKYEYFIDDEPAALADYNKAIELNPGFAKAYSNRANFYYYLNEDYLNACNDWTKAAELGDWEAKTMMTKNCSKPGPALSGTSIKYKQ